MSLRQLGFALNVYDGPLTVFLTTNFADMYSPITVILMNGAGEPLGERVVNLLDNAPNMPTSDKRCCYRAHLKEAATRPATEQTPGTPADAESTVQDPAAEPDVATEHIARIDVGGITRE